MTPTRIKEIRELVETHQESGEVSSLMYIYNLTIVDLLDELDKRDKKIELFELVMSFPQSKTESDQKSEIIKLRKVLELIKSENHSTLYGTPGYLALCDVLKEQ